MVWRRAASNPPVHVRGVAVAAAVCALCCPDSAKATPRPLPFTYPYATLPAGALELEQYADLVPMRVVREGDTGSDAVTSVRSNLETELEYGITDRVEGAFYFVFRQSATASTPALRFMGVKQRLRFRFAELGELPVDLGLYLEVAEFHNEFEFEEKLILSRRLGRFTLSANLWVEQEYYFQEEEWRHIYNPTAGVALEVTPSFSLGAEYWARGRLDEPRAEATSDDDGTQVARAARHYAGPTLMVQSQEGFASLGAYVRWDHIAESAKPDDPWGKVWIRVLFGLDL